MRAILLAFLAAVAALVAIAVLAQGSATAVPAPCKECRHRLCCSRSARGWADCTHSRERTKHGECRECRVLGKECPEEDDL